MKLLTLALALPTSAALGARPGASVALGLASAPVEPLPPAVTYRFDPGASVALVAWGGGEVALALDAAAAVTPGEPLRLSLAGPGARLVLRGTPPRAGGPFPVSATLTADGHSQSVALRGRLRGAGPGLWLTADASTPGAPRVSLGLTAR